MGPPLAERERNEKRTATAALRAAEGLARNVGMPRGRCADRSRKLTDLLLCRRDGAHILIHEGHEQIGLVSSTFSA